MTAAPTPRKDGVWEVDAVRSSVEFAAHHLAVTTTHGRFTRWTAAVHVDERNPAESFVRATIDVTSIDTANAERDEHLRALFDTESFPTAVFESTRVSSLGNRLEVTGILTLRGVTREVTLVGETTRGGGHFVFVGKTAISRKDFGVRWSAPVEWTSGVSDRVEVKLRVEAVRC